MPRQPFWGLNAIGTTPNEDPTYYTDPWDTFVINDDQLPGKCTLDNKSVTAIEVEKTKGKNSSGAKIRLLGYEPGEFDIVMRIVTPEQWDIYCDLLDKYWAGPAKAAKPPQATVNVTHPDLNARRVYQGVLIGVPPAEQSDVDGAKNFRWRFHEQVKQRPTKPIAAAGALPPEDPRQPPSVALNGPPSDPADNPANSGLSAPKLAANGGAN